MFGVLSRLQLLRIVKNRLRDLRPGLEVITNKPRVKIALPNSI